MIPAYPGGRPRETPPRDVLGAVFHVPRAGCRWRHPPKDFPPRSTAWGDVEEWRHGGLIAAARDASRARARRREGRERTPSAGGTDSRSAPATAGGERRGYDARKKVNGRQRHAVVGTPGLLPAAAVTAAGAGGGAAAPR